MVDLAIGVLAGVCDGEEDVVPGVGDGYRGHAAADRLRARARLPLQRVRQAGEPAHAGLGQVGTPRLDAWPKLFAAAAKRNQVEDALLRAICNQQHHDKAADTIHGRVLAVDVGHGQLDPVIAADPGSEVLGLVANAWAGFGAAFASAGGAAPWMGFGEAVRSCLHDAAQALPLPG